MHKHRFTVAVLTLACLLAACQDRHEPTKPTVAAPTVHTAALPA